MNENDSNSISITEFESAFSDYDLSKKDGKDSIGYSFTPKSGTTNSYSEITFDVQKPSTVTKTESLDSVPDLESQGYTFKGNKYEMGSRGYSASTKVYTNDATGEEVELSVATYNGQVTSVTKTTTSIPDTGNNNTIDGETIVNVKKTESLDSVPDLKSQGYTYKGKKYGMGSRGYSASIDVYTNDATGEEVELSVTTYNGQVTSVTKTTTTPTTIAELYEEKTGKQIGTQAPEEEKPPVEETPPAEETPLPEESSKDVYESFDDFKNAANNKGYTIVGLNIPDDADSYKIENGKVIIVKAGVTIAEIALYKSFSSNSYTVGIGEEIFDIESLKSSLNDLDIKVEDIKSVRSIAIDLLDYFNENVLKISKEILTLFESINELTTEKLITYGLCVDYLIIIYNSYQNTMIHNINVVIGILAKAIKDNIEANRKGTGAQTQQIRNINAGSNNGGPSGDSSTDTSTVDETVVIDQETLTRLMPAVTGLVTFTEIVSMYEKIGNNLPIQSSEAGQYGLIGVVQENGKYYYKLLDTKTGKVYFTEIDEKSKIEWDEKGERKVVEVVDENAMILKQAGESDNGLVRIADKGDVYLLTDDNTTVDGIDYYNIMDSKTDNNAYLVSSDSVSQPKSISDLISAVDDSEVIK